MNLRNLLSRAPQHQFVSKNASNTINNYSISEAEIQKNRHIKTRQIRFQ